MWAHLLGGPESAAYEWNERGRPLFPSRRIQRRNGGIGHRYFQAEKDPAPSVLGHLVHRLSPDSLLAARAIPTAEAMGGRCPTLERLEFGPLNRRPSFRAPDWVELNFLFFSLGGKGLECGHTGGAAIHAPPTTPPPCHITGLGPSSYKDRPAGAKTARVAVYPRQI